MIDIGVPDSSSAVCGVGVGAGLKGLYIMNVDLNEEFQILAESCHCISIGFDFLYCPGATWRGQ